jgi:hypothetical protein
MTDPDKRMTEGLHVLEAVLRFTALLGLSSTPPQPLPGITLERMRSPSMQTWFDLCIRLARVHDAGDYFTLLLSFLMPGRAHKELIQGLISFRNDIAHGRAIPEQALGRRLDTLLRRLAHRAQSAWRAGIGVPVSMTYDGSSYCVEILRLTGTGAPSPATVISRDPVVTGELVLLSPNNKPLPLSPWLIAQRTDDPSLLHCLLFDGLQRTKDSSSTETPIKYSKPHKTNGRDLTSIENGGTGQALIPWVEG